MRPWWFELHPDLLIEQFDVVIKGNSADPTKSVWLRDQYMNLEIYLPSWLFPLVIDESIWTNGNKKVEQNVPEHPHYRLSAELFVSSKAGDLVFVEKCSNVKANNRRKRKKVCERLMKCTADSRTFHGGSESDLVVMINVQFAFLCTNAHHNGLPFRLKFCIAHSEEPSKPVAIAEIEVARVLCNRDPARVGQGFKIPALFMIRLMWIVTAQFWE
jgi:hypothetical protein